MRIVVALCGLAACTYPDKELEGPFTCYGAAPPVHATPLVHLSGSMADPQTLMPLPGVAVQLQDAQMLPVDNTTTDATGSFSFSLNTNGTPVGGLDLYAQLSGRVDTYYFYSRPVTADISFPFAVLSMQEATDLAAGAGLTFTMGDGTILLTVNDCVDKPIAGARIAPSVPGTIVYFSGVQPSLSANATDAGGVVMIANVMPGMVTLTASVQGMTFPPLDVQVVANAFTQTALQPGPAL